MNNIQTLSMVRNALGFLETEWNFLLREDPPQYYYFESSNCEITVIFELSKVYVSIAPIGIAKSKLLGSGIHSQDVDIKIVSQCLNPQLAFAKIPWNAKVNFEEELAIYSKLIKQYCRNMLAGDFSQWKTIETCLSKRRENS